MFCIDEGGTISLDQSIVVWSSCNFTLGIIGERISSICSTTISSGVSVSIEMSGASFTCLISLFFFFAVGCCMSDGFAQEIGYFVVGEEYSELAFIYIN